MVCAGGVCGWETWQRDNCDSLVNRIIWKLDQEYMNKKWRRIFEAHWSLICGD